MKLPTASGFRSYALGSAGIALEQFDDAEGRLCYRFTLPSAPRTKKNGSNILKIGKRIKVVPSPQWMEWRDTCLKHVLKNRVLKLGLEKRVSCAALFYRHADVGDSHGFYNGVADVLQECGVVTNDVLIRHWDGSRLLKDAANPRTQVTLTVLNDDR